MGVAFGLVWFASLELDGCGAEDDLECTTLGWTLLFGWMVLGATFAGLVLWRVIATVWTTRRIGLAELSLVALLACYLLVGAGTIHPPGWNL